MWKNSPQVFEDLYRQKEQAGELNIQVFSAHKVFKGAVLTSQLVLGSEYLDSIVLSPYGESTFQSLVDVIGEPSSQDLKAAALHLFYHHDLLLDLTKSDGIALCEAISSDIINGKILLPSRFGRELYDKFNDHFVDRAKERASYLDHSDALSLLDGTPQGNYQIGRLVLGPLGVIKTDQNRYIPPTPSVPLWHCADTGCNALHSVKLKSQTHTHFSCWQTRLARRLRIAMGRHLNGNTRCISFAFARPPTMREGSILTSLFSWRTLFTQANCKIS